jgi:hypothetical protein
MEWERPGAARPLIGIIASGKENYEIARVSAKRVNLSAHPLTTVPPFGWSTWPDM